MDHAASIGTLAGAVNDRGSMATAAGHQLPLAFARQGETVTIASIRGGGDLHHHLETLGFVEGAEVRIVAEQSGNLIVSIKGSRVAINRATANRIITR